MAFLQCEIRAESLRMDTTVIAILPHDKARAYPASTLYLFHGRSASALSWIRRSNVEAFAEKHGLAVIMPCAALSFYTDMKCGGDYFTYITEELPELCGRMFGLDNSPEKTALAGISMGGYGVLKCVLNYPERYRAAAAISALTDIRWRIEDTPADSPEYKDILGIFGPGLEPGKADDLFALARDAARAPKKPRLFMICGGNDTRLEQNRRLSELLGAGGFENTFQSRPGAHDWDFFGPALDEALRFMFETDSV